MICTRTGGSFIDLPDWRKYLFLRLNPGVPLVYPVNLCYTGMFKNKKK